MATDVVSDTGCAESCLCTVQNQAILNPAETVSPAAESFGDYYSERRPVQSGGAAGSSAICCAAD